MMTKKLSIALAAGLFLVGPARADDQDRTRTQAPTQDQTRDQTKDQTKDQTRDHTSAGIGDKVREMAKDQKAAADKGIGAQVREMAQFHGCDVNGSEECKAHHAVHNALAEKAGEPTEKPALPGEASATAGAKRGGPGHDADVEKAALRHTERMAAGEQAGEGQGARHGAGRGMGGQGMGSGDMNQAAETTRSGNMHGGGGTGTGGGMTPGGGMR